LTEVASAPVVESICDPKWPNPKKIPRKGFKWFSRWWWVPEKKSP